MAGWPGSLDWADAQTTNGSRGFHFAFRISAVLTSTLPAYTRTIPDPPALIASSSISLSSSTGPNHIPPSNPLDAISVLPRRNPLPDSLSSPSLLRLRL